MEEKIKQLIKDIENDESELWEMDDGCYGMMDDGCYRMNDGCCGCGGNMLSESRLVKRLKKLLK